MQKNLRSAARPVSTITSTLQRLLVATLFVSGTAFAQAPSLAAKSWLLIEHESGQVLSSQTPDAQIEPASLTKLMTAYLTFTALRQNTLRLDQTVPVSVAAWKAPGSRMFIDPRQTVTVGDLIQGMIIQSGNDACVALAEAISGSEAQFSERMNAEAKRLGMTQTVFRNATGLPHPEHLTTATDLGKLASAMIRDFPAEYARYYAQKEFTWNKIKQPNRNRLLWADPSVDGMKTGFTEAAGYCLVTSAKRGPRRMISIVLGTASDYARAAESQKLLDWGWNAFEAVQLYEKAKTVASLRVWKGEANAVAAGFPDDLVIAVPRGQSAQVKAEFVAAPSVVAPVAAGQALGVVRVSVGGQALGDYPVVALQAVPSAGMLGQWFDTVRMWFSA